MYIYIKFYEHTSNPWESNHRDGPTGHKNRFTILPTPVTLKSQNHYHDLEWKIRVT